MTAFQAGGIISPSGLNREKKSKPSCARIDAVGAHRVVGFSEKAASSGFADMKRSDSRRRSREILDHDLQGINDQCSVKLSSSAPNTLPSRRKSSFTSYEYFEAPTKPLAIKPRPIRKAINVARSATMSPSVDDKEYGVSLPGSLLKDSILSSPRCLTNSAEMLINNFSMQSKCLTKSNLKELQKDFEVFTNPLVVRAYAVANTAHKDQLRKNGEPVFNHVLETTKILARLGMDERVVAAGLLHDILDDTPMTEEFLLETIGDKDVVDLVKGVSKLSDMSQMHRDSLYDTHETEKTSERWRSIVLAMCDVRIVLIKLADRLHNMRTLDALPHVKRIRMATETRHLFAPLANRLGVWSVKAELEDLCFQWLEPEEYRTLKAEMDKYDSENLIETLESLRACLEKDNIIFEDLCGRPKNIYSIYKKIKKKDVTFEEIYDRHAVRVIVNDEKLCYRALDAIHELWEPLQDKQKDYIKKKKPNGYQSLHTVVKSQNGQPLEVQIRTNEMHFIAEYGIAAHWRYKEGSKTSQPDRFIERRVAWARWVLNWQAELNDQKAHIEGDSPKAHLSLNHSSVLPEEMEFLNMKNPWTDESGDAFNMGLSELNNDGPVYVVLVDKFDVKVREMPNGSTMNDLVRAEDFHDGAYTFTRNNSEEFSLNQKVEMGDVIEIIDDEIPQASAISDPYIKEDVSLDFDIDDLYYSTINEDRLEKERARLSRMYNSMYDKPRAEALEV